MRIYIKSIDEPAWRSILIGWEPLRTSVDEDNEVTFKRELDWTADEITTTSFNFKVLNVIFATIDIYMFKILYQIIFQQKMHGTWFKSIVKDQKV
ncbi:hypothetical protein ACS0TY_030635 [Phlomoides rotata]